MLPNWRADRARRPLEGHSRDQRSSGNTPDEGLVIFFFLSHGCLHVQCVGEALHTFCFFRSLFRVRIACLVVDRVVRSSRTRVLPTTHASPSYVQFCCFFFVQLTFVELFWHSLALLHCGKCFVSSTTSQTTVVILTMSVSSVVSCGRSS